ncbi:hypothetical protein [Streptomyces melanogenes]|uniref:hypothetical protein n=1 Tax=Streptomyces melanogenes TaxID=67326 RepID=UPI0037B00B3A
MGNGAQISSNLVIREILWKAFPEERHRLSDLEIAEQEFARSSGGPNEWGEVGMYTLVSEILVGRSFEKLFSAPELDEDLAWRCSRAIEEMLGSGREDVVEMVSLRVTDYLLGYVDPWLKFKQFAGPLLKVEVGERKVFYTGPF